MSTMARLASSRPARAAVNSAFAAWSRRRVASLARCDPSAIQAATLRDLVRKAAGTRFGRDHRFGSIRGVEDFQKAVPLRTYETLWADYLRDAYPILHNVAWPGTIPHLALTSGTTQGATKYIPVSREMLASNFLASRTMLAHRYALRPDSRLFRGKMFFLGGSTALEGVAPGVTQGDLSGIVATKVPATSRPYTFPPLDLALEPDWDRKLSRLAERSVGEPITLVGGVPSWLLALFDRVRSASGKSSLAEVWPRLEVVVHGGVKFDPYRAAFDEALAGSRVATQDAYACSEGFIAHGDPGEPGVLRLLFDHGIFLEFVPARELGSARPTRHWLGTAEVGVNYALVVSTCAGLWGHVVGDTVRFDRLDPPRITFTGRTRHTLSAFGEHLIGEEIESAVAEAAERTGSLVRDWHVGPVVSGSSGHHLYLVEFLRPPVDVGAFVDRLDASLLRRNDDYRAHRAPGVGIAPPRVIVVAQGGFDGWMRSVGKLGGQHKLPRVDDSGLLTAQMAAFLAPHHLP